MSHFELGVTGVRDDVQSVRSGLRTATELMASAQERVSHRDAETRAWVHLSDAASRTAHSRDQCPHDLPLRGLIIGVKDIIDAAGLPTRCGSPATTSAGPLHTSAACVRRLESLGAIVLGKTATTEYGYFAPASTRNPTAPGHTPGGSSSGSAAAVAAGIVPLALGTQTAGSVTRPASYCGVVGMVLAHGTVDMSGVTGLSWSLDSLGLLARSVRDVAHVHQLLTGSATSSSHHEPAPVHVWRGRGLDPLDRSMTAAVEITASRLEDEQRRVTDLEWDDHIFTLLSDQPMVMAYEAARQRSHLLSSTDRISQPLTQLLQDGENIREESYRAALVRCAASRTRLEQLLEDEGGVIIGPAALGPPPLGLDATGSPQASRPWQALGLPVVTVPGIRTRDGGLPLGIQVIGTPGREHRVLEVAVAVERLMAETTV